MNQAQGDWRRDPAGRHELRYWDGATWTEHVSDQGQQTTEAYDGTVAPVPTTAVAPVAGQPTVVVRKGHGCLWAALIVGVLVIGGIIIVAVGINQAVDNLNAEQAKHAITKTQFDVVRLGVSQATLEQQLGKSPENTQEFVTKGVVSQADINSSCVYYNQVGQSFGSRFQFCFDNDALTAKNAY